MARGSGKTNHKFISINNGLVNEFNFSLMLRQSRDPNESKSYSITEFIDNFSVRQSLLRYSMSIELASRDAAGLVDSSLLKMGSILELSLIRDFDDPTSEINKIFYVTNINSSIQSATPNERVYDITAYTFAGVSNAWPFTNVYPAGETPSEIIKDIVKSKFTIKPEEIGEDNIDWIKTENTLNTPTIFKQVAPFDAITNMLRRSVRITEKDSTYFFYEDALGFKLKTIGDMTKPEYLASAIKYTLLPDKKLTGNFNLDYYKVLYLTQHNNSDFFKIMENGVHSSEVVYIDLLNRTVGNNNSKYVFKYKDDEHRKALLSLGEYDAFDITREIFEREGLPDPDSSVASDSQYDFTPASKIVFSETAWDRTDYMHDKYPYDAAQRALFEQNKVSIEVYGNPEIRPGIIIYLQIPKQQQETGYSKRLDGYYLVTGVRHNVRGTTFQTIVDLHKDSYLINVLEGSKDNPSTLS